MAFSKVFPGIRLNTCKKMDNNLISIICSRPRFELSTAEYKSKMLRYTNVLFVST